MAIPQTIAHAVNVYILFNKTQQMFVAVQNTTTAYAGAGSIECEEYNAQNGDDQYGTDDSASDADTGSSRSCGTATSASESHGENEKYKILLASLPHRLSIKVHTNIFQ